MKSLNDFPRIHFGVYPTPFYKLENISRQEGRNIWIKRDDLCGVALGGNKVRKLEFLLAQAKAEGCDVIFTTGGAQSNHAMLTAACAAQMGLKCILVLKKRGVCERKGNLILDEIYGADIRFVDSDTYDDVYAEMHRLAEEMTSQGHKCYLIPVGGSTALGALGYAACMRELAVQALTAGVKPRYVVSATGSGGTTAGLVLGVKTFLPGSSVTGLAVDDDKFEEIVPQLLQEAASLMDTTITLAPGDFEMQPSFGAGYAIPNPEDTPEILSLARSEGILLDPTYTGKAWAGMLQLLRSGHFGTEGDIVFIHTGGAAALFAVDLA